MHCAAKCTEHFNMHVCDDMQEIFFYFFLQLSAGAELRVELSDLLPTIPVQTVSCSFAEQLLANMTGYIAPAAWRGEIQGIIYTMEDESKSLNGNAQTAHNQEFFSLRELSLL